MGGFFALSFILAGDPLLAAPKYLAPSSFGASPALLEQEKETYENSLCLFSLFEFLRKVRDENLGDFDNSLPAYEAYSEAFVQLAHLGIDRGILERGIDREIFHAACQEPVEYPDFLKKVEHLALSAKQAIPWEEGSKGKSLEERARAFLSQLKDKSLEGIENAVLKPEQLVTYEYYNSEPLPTAAMAAALLHQNDTDDNKEKAFQFIRTKVFITAQRLTQAQNSADVLPEIAEAAAVLFGGSSQGSKEKALAWLEQDVLRDAQQKTKQHSYYLNKACIGIYYAISRLFQKSEQPAAAKRLIQERALLPALQAEGELTRGELEKILKINAAWARSASPLSFSSLLRDESGVQSLHGAALNVEGAERGRFLIFLSSLLSAEQVFKCLSSPSFSGEEKLFILVGFYQSHQGLPANELQKGFFNLASDEYAPLYQKLSGPSVDALLIALGNIQTHQALERLKPLFDSGDEKIKKKIILAASFLAIPEAQDWLIEKMPAYPREILLSLSRLFAEYQKRGFSDDQIAQWKNEMNVRMVSGVLDGWNNVAEFISAMATYSVDPAATVPLIRYLVAGIRLQPYRQGGFGGMVEVERLPSDFQIPLGRLLENGKAFSIYPEIRRLVKALPISPNLIKELKDEARNLNLTIHNGRDSYEGVVSLFRENLHNRPNPVHLRVARAYQSYLVTHDVSELAKLGYPILPDDAGSYETLHKDRRKLAAANETLTGLIAQLEAVYGEKSVGRFLETCGAFEKMEKGGAPLKEDIQKLLQRICSAEKIGGRKILIHFDSLQINELLNLLEILSSLRTQISAELGASLEGDRKMLLTRLDIDLDALFYQLASRLLTKMHEKGASDLQIEKGLLLLIGLVQTQISSDERPELNLIQNELQSFRGEEYLHSSSREKQLRFYPVMQRLDRLVRKISTEMMATYQLQAETYSRLAGIPIAETKDFAANLLREEAIYQLSLLVQMVEEHFASELGLEWTVVRPGEARGRLLFVENPCELEENSSGEKISHLQKVIYTLTEPVILVVEEIPDDTTFDEKVRGFVTLKEQGVLSHVAIRADQKGTVMVSPLLRKLEKFHQLKKQAMENSKGWVHIEAGSNEFSILEIDPPSPEKEQPAPLKKIEPLEADLSFRRPGVLDDSYGENQIGKKATMLRELGKIRIQSTPKSFCLPFGFFEELLDQNGKIGKEIKSLRDDLMLRSLKYQALNERLAKLREIIGKLTFSEKIARQIRAALGEGPYMVRSSTNAEDLENYPGAGLYDSFAQVPSRELIPAVKKVYQSLYSEKAFFDRRKAGMAEKKVYPAVLIQKMVSPSYSFVMHTEDPTGRPEDVLIELVPGLGESLVSGAAKFQGAPHRLRLKQRQRGHLFSDVERVRFCDKSYCLEALPEGGTQSRLIDYTQDLFTQELNFRLLMKLGKLALKCQAHFKKPQDIEGAIEWVDGRFLIRLFQTRAQVVKRNPAGNPSKSNPPVQGKSPAPDEAGIASSI